MLHYAMAAFENVRLNPVESDLRFTPSILQSLKLWQQPGSWLITKREFGWFEPTAIDELIEYTLEENIAVIHLVRDPRDVLISRHAGNDNDEFYVDPHRWQMSIEAGEKMMLAVEGKVPALTLKYEDIVLNSDECEARLVKELGFIKNPNLGKLSELADNMSTMGLEANPWMKQALHRLRNFDQRSVGSWKQDRQKRDYLRNLLDENPDIHRDMIKFMKRYGYDYAEVI